MEHRDLLAAQGIRNVQEEKQKPVEEEEDVECVETKIKIWDGDEYDEYDSEYLNQIFPYKINRKTVTPQAQFTFHFLSKSLHYWIELSHPHEQEEGKLGKRDIKVIEQILRTDQSDNHIAFHRWGERFNKQEEWLKQQQAQPSYQPPAGQLLQTYHRGDDTFQIMRYSGDDKAFVEYKKRIEVLMLFYIDGVSFIFEEMDTWVYFVIYCRKGGKGGRQFVGVLSQYVFRLTVMKERHRISQVLILPAHQKLGHGKQLLDLVYRLSLQNSHCFEITTEIPSFEYQCLRDYKQLQMLIKGGFLSDQKIPILTNREQIEEARRQILQKETVRRIKEELKIPGHQIQRLANIVLYWRVQEQMGRAHFEEELRQKIITNRSPFKTRRSLPHITFYQKVPVLKQFFLQKAREDMLRNQEEVQQILSETLKGYTRVISKLRKGELLRPISNGH